MSTCTLADHDALRTSDQFSKLEYIGRQVVCLSYDLELRNCFCGSTITSRIAHVPCSYDHELELDDSDE